MDDGMRLVERLRKAASALRDYDRSFVPIAELDAAADMIEHLLDENARLKRDRTRILAAITAKESNT